MGKGRKPCCEKSKVKRGAWSPQEDLKLITFIQHYGHDNWRALPNQAGLARCGKSCRLRWTNYLRPDLKRGNFTEKEEEAIINLHQTLGNKWSKIASNFPGRTDNEIKNLWNTHLKKRAAKLQDSAATYSPSSFSTTTNHSKRKATETETDDGNDDCHHRLRRRMDTVNGGATEKPRVSGEDTGPIISTNSSSSSTDSNSTPAAVISTTAGGDGFEALLANEFSPPANFGLTGDIPVEIPFELDVDFWDFLDGLDPFEEHNKNNNNGGHENSFDQSLNLGEIERKQWLRCIENELGLEPTGIIAGEQDSGKSLDVVIPPEVNLDIGYSHLWPSL